MSGFPLVSVITVCKNPGDVIRNTFKSVVEQSYSNIEYIIIDGGSYDGTLDWLTDLPQKNHISKLVSEADEGIYSAINKGIRAASGELIGILHAGDIYHQDAIFNVVQVFLKERADCKVIAGGMRLISPDGKQFKNYVLPKDALKQLAYRMSLNHPSVFIARDAYLRSGLFDESYRFAGDYELLRRFYKCGECFILISDILTTMAYGGVSTLPKNLFKVALEFGRAQFGSEFSLKKLKSICKFIIINGISILRKNIFRWGRNTS